MTEELTTISKENFRKLQLDTANFLEKAGKELMVPGRHLQKLSLLSEAFVILARNVEVDTTYKANALARVMRDRALRERV